MAKQPPLDGVSLVALIDGKMKRRPRPMGFWDYPAKGISTPSKKWMESLLQAQQAGKDIDDPARLRLDAGVISRQYPEDSFPGHAAWLDWPWKLQHLECGPASLLMEKLCLQPDMPQGWLHHCL